MKEEAVPSSKGKISFHVINTVEVEHSLKLGVHVYSDRGALLPLGTLTLLLAHPTDWLERPGARGAASAASVQPPSARTAQVPVVLGPRGA